MDSAFLGKQSYMTSMSEKVERENVNRKPVNQLEYGGLNFDLGTEIDENRPATVGGFH